MRLAIVSPCYNEEQIIESSADLLNKTLDKLIKIGKISEDSYIMFIDDGSTDNTWEQICRLHQSASNLYAIRLGQNVGHQNAILAGLLAVHHNADAAITIDSDLQDDLNAIEAMIDSFKNGSDVVYGVKENRDVDSLFKRMTARIFYRIQRSCGIQTIENHADFRLLSKFALDKLSEYPERNIYLRGIIPLMGLKTTIVKYKLKVREYGKSKYTFTKMLSLASDGITSFSTSPINYIIILGFIMLLIALIAFLYVIISLMLGNVVPGWASLMLSIWFIGAVIILSVGVVGLYVGKVYIEVKCRPLYSIVEYLDNNILSKS